MDYMDVYTPYTMVFMAAVTSCVMISALLAAYFAVKVRLNLLFWSCLCVQASLLIWLCGKTFELIAPVQKIILTQITVQKYGALLVVLVFLMFSFSLIKRTNKLPFYAIIVGAVILACAACTILAVPKIFFDYSPICALLTWTIVVFYQRHNIFAELSDMSIDAFMEKADDAIVIFDRSGMIMDCNETAKCVFPAIGKNSTIDSFYDYLNVKIFPGGTSLPAVEDSQTQTEIGLECQDGLHYYLFSETLLKNKKNMPIATILTFHDVSEKTLLLNELEKKNMQLNKVNIELNNYITVSHRLEDEKEKNRAILEIQQTLGQSIAELLLGLEALRTADGQGQDDGVKKKLCEIINNCRSVMSDIRKSVENLTTFDAGKEQTHDQDCSR